MASIEQRKWEVREGEPGPGPVVYWMQREQRAADNFGLLYAQSRARELKRPLGAIFCLVDSFLGAGMRQFAFMLRGLEETEEKLRRKNIPFFLLRGDPGKEIPRFVKKCQAALLVGDFNPLRLPLTWQKKVARAVTVPFDEIDSHNIVPCRIASDKQEYAAYTFRPKIHKLLPDFLKKPPTLKKHPINWPGSTDIPVYGPSSRPSPHRQECLCYTADGSTDIPVCGPSSRPSPHRQECLCYTAEGSTDIPVCGPSSRPSPHRQECLCYTAEGSTDIPVCVSVDWEKALASLKVDSSIGEVDWIKPGEKAARARLKKFIKEKLARYPEDRNDPNLDGQSGLSPYLHFGQLSPLRAALEVRNSSAPKEAKEAFLEELIVRRELSDNFCFYQPKYDRVEGFPEWAKKNAAGHRSDRREYIYTPKQLEAAGTHDDLWNAAQTELVVRGTIPGYLRMYWGKKILEWSESAEQALATAIDLNDRYQLDGRDSNGYAGVAWAVGGVHDRPWPSRPVFGKVRYMNYNGCRRKFNVKAFIFRAMKK